MYNEITGPDLTGLILVKSGRVKVDFNGIWQEVMCQWRTQNMAKMVIFV